MPWAGMNTIAAPGDAPNGKGPVVRNFLPHFPGKLVVRGPIDGKAFFQDIQSAGPLGIAVGAWSHNNKVLIARDAVSFSGTVPPWKTPYIKVTELGKLAVPNTTMSLINTAPSGKEEFLAAPVSEEAQIRVPCLTSARLEEFSYGFGYGRKGAFTNRNGGLESIRPLLKWTGDRSEPIVLSTAPASGQSIKTYLNTLFVLGGVSPDTTTTWSVVPREVSSATKAASSTLNFTGNWLTYFTVGKGIKSLKTTIPSGATISSAVFEAGTTKVVINKEITTTLVGTVETERPTNKPEPNTLFYVTPGVAIEDSLTSWKSPTTGLVNRIIVGEDNANDFGVSMAVVNQTLMIFKRYSVWALYGTSPETFQIRNLTKEFGCVDPWSVCEANSGVYFMSQSGLQFWNGETFQQMDTEIENVTVPAMNEAAGEIVDQAFATVFGRVSVISLNQDYIMMSITKQENIGSGGSIVGTPFSAIMNVSSGNWSEINSTSLVQEGGMTMLGRTNQYPFVFDGRFIMDLASVTAVGEGVNLDTVNGKHMIEAKVVTDRVVLSTPGYVSQLHRIMQDYKYQINGKTDATAAFNGWMLSIKDGDSTVIQEEVQLPPHGYPVTKYLAGRRWEADNFNEVVDAHVEIENSHEVEIMEPVGPELYDATFEFVMTRQRRST